MNPTAPLPLVFQGMLGLNLTKFGKSRKMSQTYFFQEFVFMESKTFLLFEISEMEQIKKKMESCKSGKSSKF